MIFLKLVKKLDARQKMTHICARFIHLAGRPYMSLYQHMLVFMRLWQQSHFLSPGFFLTIKTHPFLKRLSGGGNMADEFPGGAVVFTVLNLTHWLDGTTQTYIIWMNR